MRKDDFPSLADSTEFRQTLQARAPRIVHGTAILLVTLLGTALAWSAVAKADLVVPGLGIVRPATSVAEVKPRIGGQVEKVFYKEGHSVTKGDLLIKFGTEQVDNEIESYKQTIRAGEAELALMAHEEKALKKDFRATRETTQAKLREAREEIVVKKQEQAARIRTAEAELANAKDDNNRFEQDKSSTPRQRVEAQMQVKRAEGNVQLARVKIPESKVATLESELKRVTTEYQKNQAAQKLKQFAKQKEVEAARTKLEGLAKEREKAFLRATISGVVTSREVKEGDVLKAEQTVVVIAAQEDRFHFEVAVPSGEVGHLVHRQREEMPVRIKLDDYDHQKYGTVEGKVLSISEDSEVRDGRTFFLVKIELQAKEIGQGELRRPVKLGMAGRAEIVTEQESLLALLVKKVRQTISIG